VARGFEDINLDEHLTREQIVRYVNRAGSVDEILAVAQHLDRCDACRDAAAVIAASEEARWPRGVPRSHR
jgi:anti-sigma factor RsiW